MSPKQSHMRFTECSLCVKEKKKNKKDNIKTISSINCIAKAVILKSTVACTVISLSILWYRICSAILQLLFFFLFLFWSLCFNKYIFYGTKGKKPTPCFMCLTGVCRPWVEAKTRTQISSAPFFFCRLSFFIIIIIYTNIKHRLSTCSPFYLIFLLLPCVFCNVFRTENGACGAEGKTRLDGSYSSELLSSTFQVRVDVTVDSVICTSRTEDHNAVPSDHNETNNR